jgi:hypothetical protein
MTTTTVPESRAAALAVTDRLAAIDEQLAALPHMLTDEERVLRNRLLDERGVLATDQTTHEQRSPK